MKKIILTFLFLFVGFVAFAQTPQLSATYDSQHEEKAEFMTNQIESLITDLSSEQKTMLIKANTKYFFAEDRLPTRITSVEVEAERNAQLASLRAQLNEKYDRGMRKILTDAQYALLSPNLDSFFSNVATTFGE